MADTPKRVVPVTVDVIPTGPDSVDIKCSPNPADIVKHSSNVLITFTLATTGYRFRKSKTIELDVAQDDFPYASWTITDTQACLYDRNKNADTLKYTVWVVDVATGKEYSVDPEIKNGGGGGGDGDC